MEPVYIDTDVISRLLEDGWAVDGYSTALMAAGAMTHSILLGKGNELVSANTTISAGWTGAKTFTRILAFKPTGYGATWIDWLAQGLNR